MELKYVLLLRPRKHFPISDNQMKPIICFFTSKREKKKNEKLIYSTNCHFSLCFLYFTKNLHTVHKCTQNINLFIYLNGIYIDSISNIQSNFLEKDCGQPSQAIV